MLWIATEFDTADDSHDAIIVEADEAHVAAARAAEILWNEALDRADSKDWPDPPESMFVVPWDYEDGVVDTPARRVAYTISMRATASLAPLQCCGTEDGHAGGCRERER